MLKSLHIENIAVIESADIEPVSGFNALTGETGAGKSIIIDAINATSILKTGAVVNLDADRGVVSSSTGHFQEM